jgi:amino acid adenylation domain-containing protein
MQKEIIKGFRLSPQQKHLWLLQQAAPSLLYRTQCAVLIKGNLNPKILKIALQNVVNRHEILRTTFHRLPAMTIPLQVINDRIILSIHNLDLSGLDTQEQEVRIEALFQEVGQLPFDFEQGPLLHISLVILSPSNHVLLVSSPALCADTAALKNLVREISRVYAGCLHNEKLSDEPIQYICVSEWHNELLEAEEAEIGREYWRTKNISNFLTLKLPFENQTSGKPGFDPQIFTVTINPDLVAKIEALVSEYDTSAPAFLLVCWQILLWRLTGQSDIMVGTACDGRADEELKGALGLFTKYLPIHCHLEENLQFSEVLEQVDEAIREAYEWQECFAWEQILGGADNVTGSSFFPFCFDFEEQLSGDFSTDVSFSIYKQYACVDRFKVKLSCVRRHDSLIAEFHYDFELFLVEDIKRLTCQFHTLLESVINKPKAAIIELEILSNVERQQLLVEFNNTKSDYPKNKCLHQLFEEQVEHTPGNIAVVFEDQQLTYTELNARANQLAHHLQKLGVRPEVLVAICVERSLEMVIGLLGVLKAGGAYLPVDPTYPKERLAFMLEDAQTLVLLTQQRLLGNLPEHGAHVVCLDTGCEIMDRESEENPVSGVATDNLAYVIYTSGSTGRPKGVMISHRAICNHMFWLQMSFALTEADKVLQKTPFSFDASIWEFYAPLLVGAQLLMARPGGHQDSFYLVKVIRDQKVTTLQLVPSLLRMLLEEGGIETCKSLRRLLCGGEGLPVDLQERFFANLDAELHNLYGPTEACIDATYWTCKRGSHLQTVPIGRPIANTQVYILDRHLQPVPIGIPGELHIGGAGLARGYLNRPDLTEEKFIPNPFSDEPGARLYKTGDLARYLSDGNIQFLGRLDHQVKIRGFRIELGEIEAVLAQHPAVRATVVMAREDQPGYKHLVAYVVPNQKQVPTSSELRSFLKEKLPEYMVAAAFVLLDALPLTPNGKVDRRALPTPDGARLEVEETFVPPRTPVEEILAEIWSEVLGLERVGIYDNFFELGGHSLLATQVISRAREAFQVELSLRSLLEKPTVVSLAERIETHRWAVQDPPDSPSAATMNNREEGEI